MKHGEFIRLKRIEKGFSQENMAEKLNISQPAYAKIETSKTKLETSRAKAIANILQIKVEEIIHCDEDNITINEVKYSQVGSGENHNHDIQTIELLKEQVNEKKETIIEQKKEIDFLRKESHSLKSQITSLLKKFTK